MIKEKWSDSTGSYIRLSGDDKERVCDKILTGNCVEGILPLDIEYVNGSREYVYETSGYKPLSEVLEDKPLSKDEWICLLTGILRTGCELEGYLLDSEHMVISIDTVFIKTRDMTVGCIYKAEHKASLAEQLNRLCEQELKYPEYDREQTGFIYRLHSITVGENVTVKIIRDFLTEEGGENEKYETEEEDKHLPAGRSGAKGKEKTKEAKKKMGSQVGKEKENRVSSYAAPICMICAGFIVPTLCVYLGLLRSPVSGNTDVAKTICAYVFFMVVAGYGAFRLCPRRNHAIVWDEEEELSICLLPQASGLAAIPMAIFPWQVGRDEKSVDAVIDREGVSPVHARFDKESTSVYVTDEESFSGTLLNRNRLTPWEKTRIKDGDILSFGAASYVVEITEG